MSLSLDPPGFGSPFSWTKLIKIFRLGLRFSTALGHVLKSPWPPWHFTATLCSSLNLRTLSFLDNKDNMSLSLPC